MLNNLEVEMRANELHNKIVQQQTTEHQFKIVHNPYTTYNQTYYEVIPSRSSRFKIYLKIILTYSQCFYDWVILNLI